jgi:hypothetical protein
MKPFSADILFETALVLTDFHAVGKGTISDADAADIVQVLENTLLALNQFELSVSARHVTDTIANVKTKLIDSYEALSEQIDTLKTVIDLELESILCLRIAPEKVKFYQETKGFGENVANRFPSAAFDIEEAGKCYACNRNTACVMHLARAVEVGLKSVMASLGLSVPTGRQPSWGEVLRDIWNEIGNRNKAADPAWTGQQKAFFENIHADLSSVKNAWRNPSMHADKVYDSERAEDIYNSVRGFMRHLAEHLDEAGNFTP